jgi:hypothetical protein
MAFAFEFYYSSPEDEEREAQVIKDVVAGGGQLDYREPETETGGAICLTFDFENRANAETVAAALRLRGQYIEGVFDY